MKYAIFGTGGLGREVYILAKQAHPDFDDNFEGWYDDGAEKGSNVMGFPVLGSLQDLNARESEIGLFMGLGDARTKKKVVKNITNKNINFPTLVHPDVDLEDYQDISFQQGTIIQQGCLLTTNIKLGEFVFLNLDCTVGHDTTIGSFSSFMPSVNISGDCIIEDTCYVGTNATIINALRIGEGAVIGAGACAAKDIAPNTVNVGVPSKSIKTIEE